MKYTSQNKNKQLTLDLFRSSFDDLDKHNRWVVLGDTLPWAELEKIYNSRLHNNLKGAGNKPARMVIGAMIVKHKLSLSDEETIQIIRENPYMQYLCGLTELTDRPIFDPSLFVAVRNRITEKEINDMTVRLLEEERRRKAEAAARNENEHGWQGGQGCSKEEAAQNKKEDEFAKEFTDSKGRKHKGVLKMDATCANAEVRYPVDVDIVNDGCRVVDKYIGEVCKALHICKPHTAYKDARRAYLLLVKMKKRGGRLVRQILSYMLSCLGKELRLIVGVLQTAPIRVQTASSASSSRT